MKLDRAETSAGEELATDGLGVLNEAVFKRLLNFNYELNRVLKDGAPELHGRHHHFEVVLEHALFEVHFVGLAVAQVDGHLLSDVLLRTLATVNCDQIPLRWLLKHYVVYEKSQVRDVQ